jgi:hypothetical protein
MHCQVGVGFVWLCVSFRVLLHINFVDFVVELVDFVVVVVVVVVVVDDEEVCLFVHR